jgi:hypothetical protein
VDGPERRAYLEAARQAVEAEIKRVRLEGPDFRWTAVSLIPVGNRVSEAILAIPFTRDSEPDRKYCYWTYVWEQVAWEKSYRSVSGDPPGLGWVGDFVFQLDLQLGDPAEIRKAPPPDEEGVQWIRADLVWA